MYASVANCLLLYCPACVLPWPSFSHVASKLAAGTVDSSSFTACNQCGSPAFYRAAVCACSPSSQARSDVKRLAEELTLAQKQISSLHARAEKVSNSSVHKCCASRPKLSVEHQHQVQ